jgi:hypothetical protein
LREAALAEGKVLAGRMRAARLSVVMEDSEAEYEC